MDLRDAFASFCTRLGGELTEERVVEKDTGALKKILRCKIPAQIIKLKRSDEGYIVIEAPQQGEAMEIPLDYDAVRIYVDNGSYLSKMRNEGEKYVSSTDIESNDITVIELGVTENPIEETRTLELDVLRRV